MTPAQAQAIMRHLASQHGQHLAAQARMREALVGRLWGPQQSGFVLDPAPRTLARCGRRAGKTVGVGIMLLLAVLASPRARACYIALTRGNAKKLMLPELEGLCDACGIPCRVNISDLTLEIGHDGAAIFLGGADNEGQIDKYRQFAFDLVTLDEMAFFGPHIIDLIDSALEPTLLDRNGRMAGISSPGYVRLGKFYDMDQPGSGWSRHHWTVLQNPHIPNAATWLADLRARRGWDANHPTYRREYLGEWVDDTTALCFPSYTAERNGFDGTLAGQHTWQYVLGVDVGYDPDPSTFVVLAHSDTQKTAHVVLSQREVQWTPTRVWDHVERLYRQYQFSRIVCDGTKGQVAELAQRFAIPVEAPPDKHLKRQHIALIDDDLLHGRLKIADSCHALLQEFRTVVWDAERKAPVKTVPNDCCDALEYAWAVATHFAAREPLELTPDDRIQLEETRLREHAEAQARDDGRDPYAVW